MKTACPNCGLMEEGKFCSNCGHVLDVMAPSVDTDDTIKVLAKTLGIQEFVQILLSIHAPVSRIRAFLSSGNLVLSRVVTAYIEMLTLIPFIQREVILRAGNAVGYPVIVQGQMFETKLIYYLFAAIGSAIGLAIIYILPKWLLEPSKRSALFAVNLQLSMYCVLYLFITDILKILIWTATSSFTAAVVIGWVAIVATTVFTIYVWRRLLTLKWATIVLLIVLGSVVSFAQGFFMARAGFLHF